MADISFGIAWKELKIAKIAQGNVLFQLLNLVSINGHGFCELSRLLMMKNVSKYSPIRRGSARMWYLCIGKGREGCHCSLRKDLKGLTGAFYGSENGNKAFWFSFISYFSYLDGALATAKRVAAFQTGF